MGLNATLITFSPNTVIASADMNANLNALNNASAPTFTSVGSQAPVTLTAGHQEGGACGTVEQPTGASQNVGYFVNFKTHLTSTPSSLTFTRNGTNSGNMTGPFSSIFTTDGFLFFITSVAAGTAFWYGSYVTVGNCLLAVDTQAETFDHHCDGCGRVSRRLALATALHVTPAAPLEGLPLPVLAYTCPDCGAVECFNTALSARDEQDETRQGAGEYLTTRGAQAQMIRALQRLLALPLVA